MLLSKDLPKFTSGAYVEVCFAQLRNTCCGVGEVRELPAFCVNFVSRIVGSSGMGEIIAF